MPIEKLRSSLNSDDLKVFDDIIKYHDVTDCENNIIGFRDVKNFIIETKFNVNPKTGLRCFKDGKLVEIVCF